MKVRIDLLLIVILLVIVYLNKLNIYILILLFTLTHELAHMIVAVALGYKIEKLNFSIVGLSIKLNNKIDGYNKKVLKGNKNNIEKTLIALAGPLFNIITIILLIFNLFNINNIDLIIYINLMICIFNLIPIYPLDGYIILSNLLGLIFGNINSKKYLYYISNIVMFLISTASSILILKYKNIWILIILCFLYILNVKENKRYMSKINLYKRYEKLKNK